MPTVELIYDPDCPHIADARTQLERAFAMLKLRARWTEWSVSDPSAPERIRGFGSPTILVDGRDVSGEPARAAGASCRVYGGEQGLRGAPSAEQIAPFLRNARGSGGAWTSLATLPAGAASLLPILSCPACWPAYAGALGSLGLGFLLERTYLLSLTASLLALAMVALAYRARTRRGFLPLALGALASALVLLGKFAWTSDAIAYAGVALLIAASVWNGWPRSTSKPCAACAEGGR